MTIPAKFRISLLSAAVITLQSHAATDPTELSPVVVTAKAPVSAEDFAGTVSVVTAEDIELIGATNLLEAIESLPGLSTSRVGSGREGIRIRGMQTDHTLILVDGKRISDTDATVPFSNFQYNWVPVGMIDRIEVIRGPMSNLYGSSAIGGVINIITKGAGKEWKQSARAEASKIHSADGGDEYAVSYSARGPLSDKADLKFSIEHRKSDPFQKEFNVNGNQLKSSEQGKKLTNILAETGINLPNNDLLTLGIIYGKEEREDHPSTPYYDIKRHQVSVGYETSLAGFDVKALAYQSQSKNKNISGGYNRNITENMATLDITGNLTDNQILSAGAEYSTEESERTDISFKDKFTNLSAFAEDRIALTDSLTFTAGARYDDHKQYGSKFSPKAYLNYAFSDVVGFKLGYGQGFKSPSVNEGSENYIYTNKSAGYQIIGNGNLKPETSKTFEAGLSIHTGDLNFSTTLFYNDVENLITTKSLGFDPAQGVVRLQYTNVNNAKIKGIETTAGYRVNEAIQLDFSHTYLDPKDKDTDERLEKRSDHEVSAAVTYKMAALGLKTKLDWQYIGSQYETRSVRGPNARSIKAKIPGYDLFNLSFHKRFNDNVSVNFGVKNMFDVYPAEKDKNSIAGTYSDTGRELFANVTVDF
ncbi:TonB-dependent receptor plug domain-containing protein [Endozoicomonadaceae bacterium StTr2]